MACAGGGIPRLLGAVLRATMLLSPCFLREVPHPHLRTRVALVSRDKRRGRCPPCGQPWACVGFSINLRPHRPRPQPATHTRPRCAAAGQRSAPRIRTLVTDELFDVQLSRFVTLTGTLPLPFTPAGPVLVVAPLALRRCVVATPTPSRCVVARRCVRWAFLDSFLCLWPHQACLVRPRVLCHDPCAHCVTLVNPWPLNAPKRPQRQRAETSRRGGSKKRSIAASKVYSRAARARGGRGTPPGAPAGVYLKDSVSRGREAGAKLGARALRSTAPNSRRTPYGNKIYTRRANKGGTRGPHAGPRVLGSPGSGAGH